MCVSVPDIHLVLLDDSDPLGTLRPLRSSWHAADPKPLTAPRPAPSGIVSLCGPRLKDLNAPQPAPSGLRKITSEDIFKSAGLDGFLGFTSTSFSVGSKTLNKKITKYGKLFQSLRQITCQRVVFKGDWK